ncbi:hypothetical protein LCGC14_1372990 [marine sediment metagenome]|uniref:Thiamine pyrophosphate enzyme TPP-binding domain-containing protein n=1 Tax=marine sediment metagenome TaxID=412755 RepID=A0A0F9K4U5_9ZZZZ
MRQAIEKIMSEVTDECVITSCGYISREVYRAKDRDRNFYCQSAMGSTLAIGLGLAYSRKDLEVIVINGDGSALMSAGTIVLYQALALWNIKHYILNNGCYASTGGQQTCFFGTEWEGYWRTHIIKVGQHSDAPRIPLQCSEITRRFKNAIRKT